ncbi:MAG: histidine kinase [Treponema sp.]|nr:histidine kinase [Treponema sp.]
MREERLFLKIVPAFIAASFLAAAGVFFAVKYAGTDTALPPIFDINPQANRNLYFINFYIPHSLCALALGGCLFCRGFLVRSFCLLIAFATVIVAGYVLEDFFTIKLCLYGAFVIIVSSAFSFPRSIWITAGAVILFEAFLFYPGFFGGSTATHGPPPSPAWGFMLPVYLFPLCVLAVSIRRLTERYKNSEAMVAHLNLVGAQLTLFNHRLQEYVKNSGEEAVRQDRLRFTRDLHDACGYVFTNIIAIADAAMSFADMERGRRQDTFQLIQNQAREGLQRTRETLHMIRELQDPIPGSIDTLFKMKAIFEEVTGIRVEIESGNMRQDYGPAVNRVLTRIVQEAFTNSVRHGKASLIQIHFWEFPAGEPLPGEKPACLRGESPGVLTMTVSDNGIGTRQVVKGIGLAGMEERLVSVGGTMDILSSGDQGFRLRVKIPLGPAAGRGVPPAEPEVTAPDA